MKLSPNRKLITIAAAALVAAGTLAAQGPGMGAPRPGNMDRGAHFGEFLATYLDLTDSQKAQVKSIQDAAKAEATPVETQLKAGRQALSDAVKAGKSDGELNALAAQEGVLMGQLAGIHARSLAKIYALLTPDQKDKLSKLGGQAGGMFGNRFRGGMMP